MADVDSRAETGILGHGSVVVKRDLIFRWLHTGRCGKVIGERAGERGKIVVLGLWRAPIMGACGL